MSQMVMTCGKMINHVLTVMITQMMILMEEESVNNDANNNINSFVATEWNERHEVLLYYYSCIGLMWSPNPIIMKWFQQETVEMLENR